MRVLTRYFFNPMFENVKGGLSQNLSHRGLAWFYYIFNRLSAWSRCKNAFFTVTGENTLEAGVDLMPSEYEGGQSMSYWFSMDFSLHENPEAKHLKQTGCSLSIPDDKGSRSTLTDFDLVGKRPFRHLLERPPAKIDFHPVLTLTQCRWYGEMNEAGSLPVFYQNAVVILLVPDLSRRDGMGSFGIIYEGNGTSDPKAENTDRGK